MGKWRALTDRGIFPRRTKFVAEYRRDGAYNYVGIFSSEEEAQYRRIVAMNQGKHHWVGLKDGPYFGFTYVITNKKTGKKYVGCKQFYLWAGPRGGYKCTNPSDDWWDQKAWRENDWHFYTGSSDQLNAEIADGNVWDFTYEVLDMCESKLDLHLSEIQHMIEWDVLEAVDEKGEYKYYNKNILSLEYRAPFKKGDVKAALAYSEEDMRNYYLKPDHCRVCGKLIPYGKEPCCTTVSLETIGDMFDDLTCKDK